MSKILVKRLSRQGQGTWLSTLVVRECVYRGQEMQRSAPHPVR